MDEPTAVEIVDEALDEASPPPDGGDDAGDDGEDFQQPQASQGEQDIEQRLKQLEAARKSFSTRVSTIMGDDATLLQPCPLCWPFTGGFMFQGAPMLDEQKDAVRAAMGEGGVLDFEKDPGRNACEACKGKGKLRTDSLVPGQEAPPCRACNGQGWTGEGNPPRPLTSVAPTVFTFEQAPANGPGQPPPDQWGRPFGHPHFGQSPAMVGMS